MYKCTHCGVLACIDEHPESTPKNCPMISEGLLEDSFSEYEKDENKNFHIKSTEIEAAGYGQWPRVREIVEFSKSMKYKKIGIAFCLGLHEEAKILDRILVDAGFDTISVICKTGGTAKEKIGISDDRKVRPGTFEPICNPIAQAKLLNEQQSDFNIVVGLCVGHDSMFYKYSDAMVTTLIAKDRVLAHNPAGAIYCSNGYFKSKISDKQ